MSFCEICAVLCRFRSACLRASRASNVRRRMTTFFIVIVYAYSKTTSALVRLLTRRTRHLEARSANHRDVTVQKGPMSALAVSLQC
jgi:hypothetical protein